MIEIGRVQKLRIVNMVSIGAYLDAGTDRREDNILLPKNQLPEEAVEGDELEVFIYNDSENRLIATMKKPYAQAGELAYLKVEDETPYGHFLDLGTDKQILLPFKEQKYKVSIGQKYLVGIYVDDRTERLCATTDITEYLSSDSPYKKNDKVTGTVYKIVQDIGVLVAVDNKYFGLIPKNEYFHSIKNGDIVNVRVIRVREDGKLDLSPREVAHKQIDIDAELIYTTLNKHNGFLQLTDKSNPETIKQTLNLSKKAFKRAFGNLLKNKRVKQLENGIQIIECKKVTEKE